MSQIHEDIKQLVVAPGILFSSGHFQILLPNSMSLARRGNPVPGKRVCLGECYQ